VKTGDFSYTLYVIHFPILALGLSLPLSISVAALVISVCAAPLLEDAALQSGRWWQASNTD
jgi:peptidoglycan/LPS O-acetylase OafA/YrhL